MMRDLYTGYQLRMPSQQSWRSTLPRLLPLWAIGLMIVALLLFFGIVKETI
jgi:hypothetical protein